MVHIILPLFVMSMIGMRLRVALPLSLLAVVPDLDVLFGVHRSVLHSVVVVVMIFIPIIIITKVLNERIVKYAIASFMVILSHIFLDMFTGYTPVLWPLFNKSVYIVTSMTVNTVNIYDIKLTFHMYLKPVEFRLHEMDAPIFTNSGVALTCLFLVGTILKQISNHLQNT